MQFGSQIIALSKLKSDCLVFPVYERGLKSNPHLGELPRSTASQIKDLFASEIIKGKEGQTYLLKTALDVKFPYVLIIGVGKAADLKRDVYRKFGGVLANALSGAKFDNPSVFLPPSFAREIEPSILSQTIVEGITLGSYELTLYKSKPDKKRLPQRFTFLLPPRMNQRRFDAGIKAGEIFAWAQNFSRDLTAHPSNYLTPQELAATAIRLARRYGFSCQALSNAAIKKFRMNCLLAVNSGSTKPAQFIIMKYKGRGAKKAPLCLVGKGITFDSGGISIKPAQDMEQMKGDMAGAACVISVFAAAARLKLPINLIGFVPATENLPSGSAFKPGDVLTALNGKTIEVISTDAEGRLILADALSYAQRFKPEAIIDIATLTGAAIIALGYVAGGLFVNNDKLHKHLNEASDNSGEKIWQMPLWDEYQESIKSSIADIKNSGGRPGQFCTAGAFLKNFVGDYPWAHIDMAAMDIEFKGGAYKPKGASGYGVRLLLEFLRDWK